MKRQIRRGVFETNSSSTHSLVMCSEEEYERWKKGELMFDRWKERFVENAELSDEDKRKARNNYNDSKGVYWKDWEQLSEDEINLWYKRYAINNNAYSDLQSYNEYWDDCDFETFVEYHTTPKGEKIVAFGYYGYDG